MEKHLKLLLIAVIGVNMSINAENRDTLIDPCETQSMPATENLPAHHEFRHATISQHKNSPNEIRRIASRTQTDEQEVSKFLGYVTQDKLQYAVYQFQQSQQNSATLVGWVDSNDYYPYISVPDYVTFNGKQIPVTAIDENAFYGGWGINGLLIGKNVRLIAPNAFYNCAIEHVSIPETVSYILSSAFYGCPLTSVVFEEASSTKNALVIGPNAFGKTRLTKFEIPARLRLNDDSSFRASFCNPLWGTETLESITINPAFHDAPVNRNYSLEIIDNALCSRVPYEDTGRISTYVIAYPAAHEQNEFNLTSEYIDIFDGAFSSSKLGKVALNATLERREGKVNLVIGSCAFYNSHISTLSLSADGPVKLKSLFAGGCQNLEAYTLSESISNLKASDGILYGKREDEKYLVSYPAGKKAVRFTVAPDVLHLSANSFATNLNLTEITLPSELKSIGSSAFANCRNLAALRYSGSDIQDIGASAFEGTKIIESAPHGEVALGNWIIGYSGEVPENLVISENISHSVPGLFAGDTNITTVAFPKNFANIPSHMFSWCENLKKIQFPENLKTIGDYAFSGAGSATMSGLTPLTIPEGVTKIASYAFSSSRLIEKLVLPSSIEDLGNGAFDTNNNLLEVEIHRSTPPNSEGATLFSQGTLKNGTLIIPKDADPLVFTQTIGWEFRSVVNGDFSSVEHVINDNHYIRVFADTIYSTDCKFFNLYDSSGRYLGHNNSFSGLPSGVYIIQHEHVRHKIFIK